MAGTGGSASSPRDARNTAAAKSSGGVSRKLPARISAASIASTSRRNSSLPSQTSIRNFSRASSSSAEAPSKIVERDILPVLTTTLLRTGFPSVINENMPHRLSSDGEKLGSGLQCRAGFPDKTDVGFVDEGGGLERVFSALPTHVTPRHSVQFPV